MKNGGPKGACRLFTFFFQYGYAESVGVLGRVRLIDYKTVDQEFFDVSRLSIDFGHEVVHDDFRHFLIVLHDRRGHLIV